MPDPALAHLDAPTDPRTGLPAFGTMRAVHLLDETTVRVLAPNPSPMTLDGTNTYVVGVPGTGQAVVVDPGPSDPSHLAQVRQVLADRDAACRHVLVTHHHIDHAEAARSWADEFDAELLAPTPEVAGPDGRVVTDGDRVEIQGLGIEAVATPGHSSDHTAYRLGTGALLTGDHVLGRGTSVVAHPDGDLEAYLTSLRRVLDLGPDVLYPGHGPELTSDPTAVVRFYLDHRAYREKQILTLLAEGPHTPRGLVERIYVDVDERLWPAAEASTRAALGKLERAGTVCWDGDQVRLDG